jgi:hypothetical protein
MKTAKRGYKMGPEAFKSAVSNISTSSYHLGEAHMTDAPDRFIRIHRRPLDGRFITLSDQNDIPVGVDTSLSLAIATAEQEAGLMRRLGHRVVIEAQRSNGQWQRVSVIEPPRPKGSPLVRRRARLTNRVWRPSQARV